VHTTYAPPRSTSYGGSTYVPPQPGQIAEQTGSAIQGPPPSERPADKGADVAAQNGMVKPGVIPPTLRAANDHTAVQAIHSGKARGFPSSDELSDMGRGRFVWPVKGEVISRFGAAAHDLKNDGMNISASMGTGVRAAAEGEVVYAGDSVPGYGNLVLIKHPGGWVTTYGQLSKITVKMRQRVAQGEQIGEVGQTGGVDRPQLHFEVRYAPNEHEKARPIDPDLVLPQ
jgi:murein DD-endopeptidase MepM/ murein hydrolase activator NlpD